MSTPTLVRAIDNEECVHATVTLLPSFSLSLTGEEGARERKREGGREREFLFLKGMMGALAPFTYLVKRYYHS
jgi:hypothetical protein